MAQACSRRMQRRLHGLWIFVFFWVQHPRAHAIGQRVQVFPNGDIKGRRCFMQQNIVTGQIIFFRHPCQTVGDSRMRVHHRFRRARRPGSENDVGGITRLSFHRRDRRVRWLCRINNRPADTRSTNLNVRLRGLCHRLPTLGWKLRIDRDKNTAHGDHRADGHQKIHPSFQVNSHRLSRLHTGRQQCVGQAKDSSR